MIAKAWTPVSLVIARNHSNFNQSSNTPYIREQCLYILRKIRMHWQPLPRSCLALLRQSLLRRGVLMLSQACLLELREVLRYREYSSTKWLSIVDVQSEEVAAGRSILGPEANKKFHIILQLKSNDKLCHCQMIKAGFKNLPNVRSVLVIKCGTEKALIYFKNVFLNQSVTVQGCWYKYTSLNISLSSLIKNPSVDALITRFKQVSASWR